MKTGLSPAGCRYTYGTECAQVLYNIEKGYGHIYPEDEANFAEEEGEEEEEVEGEGDYHSDEGFSSEGESDE